MRLDAAVRGMVASLGDPARLHAISRRIRFLPRPDLLEGEEGRWRSTWLWLLRLGAFVVTVVNMVVAALFLIGEPLHNPLVAGGLFLIYLSQLAILQDLWLPGPRRHQVAALGVMYVGLFVAEYARPGTPDPYGAWWPMLLLITGILIASGRLEGYLRVLGIVGALLAHILMRLWDWRLSLGNIEGYIVDRYATELGQLLMISASVITGMWAGLRGAATVDSALSSVRHRHEEVAHGGQKVFEQREADRFIHDDVLHTLRMVALDREAVPARTAIEASARLARSLGEAGTEVAGHGGLRARLDDMARGLASDGIRIDVVGDEVTLPPDVQRAFQRASLEAVHNVLRHSGTNEARVLVTHTGPRIVVTIRDRGRGFSPSQRSPGRGVAESIVARMSDVGGLGWISSEPGRGTMVRLEWAPQQPGENRPWLRATYGSASQVFGALLLMAAPLVVHNVWSTALHGHYLAAPWAGWMASIAVLVVYAGAAFYGLRHGLTLLPSIGISVTAVGAILLNGLALPPGNLNANHFWMAGGALPLALLQSLFRPRRAVFLTGASLVVATVAVLWVRGSPGPFQVPVLDPPLNVLITLPILLAPLLGVAACWAIRVTLEHAAQHAMLSHETAVRNFDAALLHAAERQALHERTERRAQTVIDFVTAVGDGRLDPSDPLVRAQADELERAVRAETAPERLRAGQAWHLRREIDRLLSAGVTVKLRHGAELTSEVSAWLARLLAGLDENEVTSVRVTVLPAGSGAGWRVATVLQPASERVLVHTSGLGLSAVAEGDQVHLEHYLGGGDADALARVPGSTGTFAES
ncbi:MAG: ATP-binding protein [bacterium]|nr:ATP-binding protein [bacterium]